MSTITALGSDGQSLIYLEGVGSGATQLDPFKPKHVLQDGAIVNASQSGEWSVNLVSLPALSTGNNVIGSIANTQFAVTQVGTWTVSGTFFPDTQPISATALPLPDGAATSANQSTIIGHLDGLEGLLAGTLTVNTGLTPLTDAQLRATAVPVSGTFWQATQPISAISLPLPGGAATSANQTTIIGHLDGLEGLLAGTLTVNTGLAQPLTDTQLRASAIPVSATTLPLVTLASESGFLSYRNTALSNTAVAVKPVAGSVMGWNFINSNTTPVYVKFYNLASGSVTVGTSAVVLTVLVPPGDGTTPGMYFLEPSLIPVEVFSTAISVACVTGMSDNSTTAPATAIHASVRYK